jgi:hypothetical protein
MYLHERHVLTLPKGGSATRIIILFVVVVLRCFFCFCFFGDELRRVIFFFALALTSIYLCRFTNSCALTFFCSFFRPFWVGFCFYFTLNGQMI